MLGPAGHEHLPVTMEGGYPLGSPGEYTSFIQYENDTKLSKIKTLRLATSYIAYLMDVLAKDDPDLAEGFKAELMYVVMMYGP
nr:hypothetical protein BaRGS_000753 [Batillaria attramentaria]